MKRKLGQLETQFFAYIQMRKLRIAMQCQHNELFRLLNPKWKRGNDS